MSGSALWKCLEPLVFSTQGTSSVSLRGGFAHNHTGATLFSCHAQLHGRNQVVMVTGIQRRGAGSVKAVCVFCSSGWVDGWTDGRMGGHMPEEPTGTPVLPFPSPHCNWLGCVS